MSLSDGAIIFGACIASFVIGYIIGAYRVSRYVSRRLDEIKEDMVQIAKHSKELQQIYSKLEEENNDKTKGG